MALRDREERHLGRRRLSRRVGTHDRQAIHTRRGLVSARAAGAALEQLELVEWKRRVFALYADVRAAADPAPAWAAWRAGRNELFASHPQSPLAPAARPAFAGLDYYPYDSALRTSAHVEPAPLQELLVASSGSAPIPAERFARARFALAGEQLCLELYWIGGYGGGLFLPFADATSGVETYGGGRYLLDTVKGADLGGSGSSIVLDFNFAYNPSCCYDQRWVCPLAPPTNRLPLALRAGERVATSAPAGT